MYTCTPNKTPPKNSTMYVHCHVAGGALIRTFSILIKVNRGMKESS